MEAEQKKLEIINIDYIKESEGAYRAESEALIINNIPMIQLEMNKTKKKYYLVGWPLPFLFFCYLFIRLIFVDRTAPVSFVISPAAAAAAAVTCARH